jgi:hypothetical protein
MNHRKHLAIGLKSIELPASVMGAYLIGRGELAAGSVSIAIAVIAESTFQALKPYWE